MSLFENEMNFNQNQKNILEFIKVVLLLLIGESICKNSEYYTKSYLNKMEKHMPFRIKFGKSFRMESILEDILYKYC